MRAARKATAGIRADGAPIAGHRLFIGERKAKLGRTLTRSIYFTVTVPKQSNKQNSPRKVNGRKHSWNFSGISDDAIPLTNDPEVARAICCKWYYTILPPNHYGISDGGDCSWSSEYDERETYDDVSPLAAALRLIESERETVRRMDEWLEQHKAKLTNANRTRRR